MKEREAQKQTAAAEVEKIIKCIQRGLSDDSTKLSVADLMRLLELRRELAQSQPGRMTVRWIAECQPIPACEE